MLNEIIEQNTRDIMIIVFFDYFYDFIYKIKITML
jgi:hypothetical protein